MICTCEKISVKVDNDKKSIYVTILTIDKMLKAEFTPKSANNPLTVSNENKAFTAYNENHPFTTL